MTIKNVISNVISSVISNVITGDSDAPPLSLIYHWDETGYAAAIPPAIDSWTDKIQGLSLLKIGTGLLSQVTVNSLPAMESFTDGGLQTAASINIPTGFSVILVMGMTRYSESDFNFATDSYSGTARVTLGLSQDNIITVSNGFGTVLFDALKPNVDNQLNCYVMTAQAGGNFIAYQNDERIVEITAGSNWAFGSLFANASGASDRGTNGVACEMLIYDGVLSAEQRASIVSSLRTKWNLFDYNQADYNPEDYA